MIGNLFYTEVLMSPAIAAIGLSQIAKSRLGARILLWGGLFFMLGCSVLVMLEAQCDGSWLKGFLNCKLGPLTSYYGFLHRASMILMIAYVAIGPVLIAFTILLEWRHRIRNP